MAQLPVPSDALVVFGVTGDLAFRQIFPALQAMVRHKHLSVPVLGVARSDYNLEQLRARARESVEARGNFDPGAFQKLCGLLRFVGGDYIKNRILIILQNLCKLYQVIIRVEGFYRFQIELTSSRFRIC